MKTKETTENIIQQLIESIRAEETERESKPEVIETAVLSSHSGCVAEYHSYSRQDRQAPVYPHRTWGTW